ncbi:hypothetical protein V1478_006395, partial [Vespula squamosa]
MSEKSRQWILRIYVLLVSLSAADKAETPGDPFGLQEEESVKLAFWFRREGEGGEGEAEAVGRVVVTTPGDDDEDVEDDREGSQDEDEASDRQFMQNEAYVFKYVPTSCENEKSRREMFLESVENLSRLSRTPQRNYTGST